MELEYRIRYSDRARLDLGDIYQNILEVSLWRRSADKWSNAITNRIESLAIMPERFHIFQNNQKIHSTNVGKYKIIYEILDKEKIVSILRIVYARRNLKDLNLKSLCLI